MISQPYEIALLNVQDGVQDWTIPLVGQWTSSAYGGGFRISAEPFSILASMSPSTALHVNADDGTVPMVIVEEGYEWVPVYSRKLV